MFLWQEKDKKPPQHNSSRRMEVVNTKNNILLSMIN